MFRYEIGVDGLKRGTQSQQPAGIPCLHPSHRPPAMQRWHVTDVESRIYQAVYDGILGPFRAEHSWNFGRTFTGSWAIIVNMGFWASIVILGPFQPGGEHSRDFGPILGRTCVSLSMSTLICPYGIAYRRGFSLSNSGLFKISRPSLSLVPPRYAGLFNTLNASFYYFALLKVFMSAIRVKLTDLWEN